MITGLHHIGIAVSNLDEAIDLWTRTTGGKLVHREIVESQRVEVAVIEIGPLHVELLQPVAESSAVAKFIEKRGPGVHHIALRADSTDAELARLKAEGVALIDETSRPGAEQTRVGFLHPRALGGVLLEIVEPR